MWNRCRKAPTERRPASPPRSLWRGAICVVFFCALGGDVAEVAADPAVAAPNGKISASGGEIGGQRYGGLEGLFTAPLAERFGIQLDAMLGRVAAAELYGAGLHLFARDPQAWLIGVGALHARAGRVDVVRLGFEGELYLKSAMLSARVGHQAGDRDAGLFAGVDLRWYRGDRLALGVGAESLGGNGCFRVGVEYLPGGGNLALFADASVGAHDYAHLLVGVRYYLGEKKSLLRRHREDDPPSWGSPPLFHSLSVAQPTPVQMKTTAAEPAQAAPPPPAMPPPMLFFM